MASFCVVAGMHDMLGADTRTGGNVRLDSSWRQQSDTHISWDQIWVTFPTRYYLTSTGNSSTRK